VRTGNRSASGLPNCETKGVETLQECELRRAGINRAIELYTGQ